jgi:acetylglutamate kinase
VSDTIDPSYLGAYRGQRFVVKLGGEVVLNAAGLDALAADIAVLVREGISLALVHGGGPQADALAARLGHTPQKVNGRRITTDTDLEIAKMAYGGSINLDLLAALRRHNVRGVGLSGVDARLLTVARRPPRPVRDAATGDETLVDFGHVGDIVDVDPTVLDLLCEARMVPVIASLAADNDGAIYNVNADSVAAAIAGGWDAAKLFLLTNVPGVLADPADPASRWSVLSSTDCDDLIAQGIIHGGMLPKVQACLDALSAGVRRAHILNGALDHSLLLESFTYEGVGTMILNPADKAAYLAGRSEPVPFLAEPAGLGGKGERNRKG